MIYIFIIVIKSNLKMIEYFINFNIYFCLLFLSLHLIRIFLYPFKYYIMINNFNFTDNHFFIPTSISQIHAETLSGRTNLTFLWTLLSTCITIKCLIESSLNNSTKYSFLSLFHFIIAILSIFPLNSQMQEICLFIEIKNKIINLIHKILVFIYFIIFPLIILIINFNLISLLILIGFIFCIILFIYNYKYSSIIEAILVIVVILQFQFFNPLLF